MFNLLRKGMVVVAPLALVIGLFLPSAAMAGEASAALPSEEAGDWTAVKVECEGGGAPPCEFTATAEHSLLVAGIPVADCEVQLEGTLEEDGSSQINVGESSVEPNADLSLPIRCEEIALEQEEGRYWGNQICQFTGEGGPQFWDQIDVFFNAEGEEVKGYIYAQLTEAEGVESDPLTVDEALVDGFIDDTPFEIVADGSAGSTPFTFEPHATVESVEGSCPWDFEDLNGGG